MSARAFLDTNILVYAHDRGSGRKHVRARQVVEELWENRTGVLSTQVLQEFYVHVRRKADRPVSAAAVKRLLEDYLRWEVVVNTGPSILEALEIERRFKISFWDALIIQAANSASVGCIYSENFAHRRKFGSVVILNPFD